MIVAPLILCVLGIVFVLVGLTMLDEYIELYDLRAHAYSRPTFNLLLGIFFVVLGILFMVPLGRYLF